MNQDNKTRIIFISYSNDNINLVEILEKLIAERKDLSALIIANKREPLKPLVEKVSQGIKDSDILIPILTNKSISAQWINQEIGFASALKKTILPLIERNLISSLKGFIHKEKDLPYLFDKSSEDDFSRAAKTILDDIPLADTQSLEKDGLKKNLSKARSVKSNKEFEAKRKGFLESPDSRKLVIDELFDVMFTYLETQLDMIRKETSLFFPNEISKGNPMGYIVKEVPYCFSLVWEQPFVDMIIDSKLNMKFWKGHISFDNSIYFPSEKPILISKKLFNIDLDKELNLIWFEEKQKRFITSTEIVDESFEWLLEVISKSNK